MSADEVIVLSITLVLGIRGWFRWYVGLGRTAGFRMPPYIKPAVALIPIAAMIGIVCVLCGYASADVRSDPVYIVFYSVFGAAWLVWILWLSERFLGISATLDAVERRNPAAILMLAGILGGGAACFAGGNIGEGPGWWCVAVSSGLATVLWMVLWAVVERVTHISDAVTVERDAWAGLRIGAWLLGTGLICGNAAAGDWFSLLRTIVEFANAAWPALILAAVALYFEWQRSRRPVTDQDPSTAVSVALSVAYVAVAIAFIWFLSAHPVNPTYGLPQAENP